MSFAREGQLVKLGGGQAGLEAGQSLGNVGAQKLQPPLHTYPEADAPLDMTSLRWQFLSCEDSWHNLSAPQFPYL